MNDVSSLIDRLKANVHYQQFDKVEDLERPAWPVLQRIVAAEAALAGRGLPGTPPASPAGQWPAPAAAAVGLAPNAAPAATPLPFAPAARGGDASTGGAEAVLLSARRSGLPSSAAPQPATAAPGLASLFGRYGGRAAQAARPAGDVSLAAVFAQLERKPR